MKLITLQQWNEHLFGGRYTINTLRAWARDGNIHPAPIKIGKDWMVTADAEYRKRTPRKIPILPDCVDITLAPTDHVVLRILNQGA